MPRPLAMLRRLSLTLVLLFAALPAAAQVFDTAARSAYVLDLTTGTVLLEKNADEALPPASMSKLMTVYMLFEALHDGRVTLDTRFAVSERAHAMGGSTMFLDTRDRPTVEELIRGIVVLSGNDAAVVVAEGLAGSEDAFARIATEKAHELGMTATNLTNASGWPAPTHRMSMRDLGTLAARLITDFPELYGYFAESEFLYDGRAPQNRFNRNPLLGLGIGADGLKTGHTTEAGYGLVGSAVQGERRIVFVISGLESEAQRTQEAERIVNWAFRQFVLRTLVTRGAPVAVAPVWMGTAREVALAADADATLLLPANAVADVSAEAVFEAPLRAPVAAGQRVGEMVVRVPGMADTRLPLVATAAVPEGGFQVRLATAARHLLARALGEVAGF